MSSSIETLAQSPGFLLSRVGMTVQAGFKEILSSRGIKPLHFLLLASLNSADGVSQQELCRALTIDSGNMVELVDRLEELRLAKRSPDPRDRRRHVVTITDAGRRTLASIQADSADMERDFFQPLTEAERTHLSKALGKLYVNTPEGRRESPPVGLDAKGATR